MVLVGIGVVHDACIRTKANDEKEEKRKDGVQLRTKRKINRREGKAPNPVRYGQ